jgi:hypothetical protein
MVVVLSSCAVDRSKYKTMKCVFGSSLLARKTVREKIKTGWLEGG